jgi:hypothetical protein
VVAQQTILVVAPHAARSELDGEIDDAARVGASNDEITDENELVAGVQANVVEQELELLSAAVDVADDDGPGHGTNLGWAALGRPKTAGL